MASNATIPGGAYPDEPPDFSTIASGAAGAEPPSYQEKRDDPDEVLQPINYAMHGRFIYASPNESSPLYELSRVIHAQGLATTNIEFQRLEYRVRTKQDGTPSVTARGKDLYKIFHGPLLFADTFFTCILHSMSRRALGNHLILKRSPFPHSGFRACIASEEEGGNGPKRPRNEYFFWLKSNKATGGYEWYDSAGRLVARQAESGMETGQPEYLLMVLQPMTRRMMDGLVAFWCLWLWHQHASGITVKKGKWTEIKEFMEKPRPEGLPRPV